MCIGVRASIQIQHKYGSRYPNFEAQNDAVQYLTEKYCEIDFYCNTFKYFQPVFRNVTF
jgi:hypothetical protein